MASLQPLCLSGRVIEQKGLFPQVELLEADGINIRRILVNAKPLLQLNGGRLPVHIPRTNKYSIWENIAQIIDEK